MAIPRHGPDLVLAPGAVVLIMLIPVVGRMLNVRADQICHRGRRAGSWLSLFYSMNLVPDLDFFHLMLYRAAQTAALSLLFVPISTIAYATMPRELNGDATALFNMARNVFGGIGISVSTALVTDHQQVNSRI